MSKATLGLFFCVVALHAQAPDGASIYKKHCATCHRLFDEGIAVGPDLTHANRKDRDYLLVSIVDPSAVVRKEYLSYTVETTDGRLLNGLLVESRKVGPDVLLLTYRPAAGPADKPDGG